MKKIFNLKRQKEKRQYLRTHMTKAEITLWHNLKAKQLLGHKFRRQHGIDEYVVDFYCPELKLAIELDGESHISEDAKLNDLSRQQHIERYGVRFLRFTDDEVLGNPDRVVKTIEDVVTGLSSTTPSSPPPRGGEL